MPEPAGSLRLYPGATPDEPVDGMLSLFPAAPAGGDAGFARPVPDVPQEEQPAVADMPSPAPRRPSNPSRSRFPDEPRLLPD